MGFSLVLSDQTFEVGSGKRKAVSTSVELTTGAVALDADLATSALSPSEGALEIGRAARQDPHRHILPAQNIRQMKFGRSGCPQDCDIGHGYLPGRFVWFTAQSAAPRPP
jgi:hypothetical protein